ncbi:MAG: adenylate/guanylate cyclase domain-containing protein [Candidatus Adiutrix sp.]|jgi:adenylate cyclase|nr:adenylate/guanylate cyclase domain-containing protein [Candidatus Adiutrix sp.]
MFKPALKNLLAPLALIVGLTALAVAAEIQPPDFLARADLKIYDLWLHLQNRKPDRKPASSLAVVIDLDEAALKEYGPWPWPRFLLAELVQRLVDLGAAAVGLDLDLTAPDQTSPRRLADDLKKFRDLDLNLAGLPEDMLDYDLLLAKAISHLPVVLGARGRFAPAAGSEPLAGPAPGAPVAYTLTADPGALSSLAGSLPQTTAVAWPSAVLAAAAPAGLTDLSPDRDGVIRRVQLAALAGEDLHLALSLRTLLRALGRDQVVLRTNPYGLAAIQTGAREAPLSPNGRFNVFFKSGGTYPHFSAGDILAGRLPPGALKGRLAFVGASAPGLGDIRVTPFNRAYPGAEIHAAIIDGLATGNFLTLPPETPAIQFLLITGAGLVSGLFFAFAKPGRALAAGALLQAGTVYGSLHLFQTLGLFISPLYATLAGALPAAVLPWLRLRRRAKTRAQARRAWARQVAPETAERLARLPAGPEAGEERELTFLCAVGHDFPALARTLAPGQVINRLNRAGPPLADLIRAHQGTVDRCAGDTLTAFWNAPLPVTDHPVLAVRTALALRKALAEFNKNSSPALKMGFGLDTGPACVGRLGPPEASGYAPIGELVQVSAHLESLGRLYGAGVVVSGATRELCGEAFAFQPLDVLRVEGRAQPLAAFAPLSAEEARARSGELARYREALELYGGGDFKKALQLLTGLVAGHPEAAIYGLYKKRCEQLTAAPPAEWTGVWPPAGSR